MKGTEKNIMGYWRTGRNDGTRQWIRK